MVCTRALPIFARVEVVASIEMRERVRRQRFDRQLALASYVVAELDMLAQMAKGRSYNCIRWLEEGLPYGLLMNVATNPWLPHKCTAAALALVSALYVDRFPQTPHSGAPSLPEKLWIFSEPPLAAASTTGPPSAAAGAGALARRSSTPVVGPRTLEGPDAFPAFFLPALSAAAGDPDPVLGHPDHFKFFLLRSLSNTTVASFGVSGRILHQVPPHVTAPTPRPPLAPPAHLS